jgi:hypothetical protein
MSPHSYTGKILCYQRLTNIQCSRRYVYETPNLPLFCMADSPNLAKSCSLAILTVLYAEILLKNTADRGFPHLYKIDKR